MLPDRPSIFPAWRDQAEAPELHDQVLHDRVELLVPARAQEDVVELVVQVEAAAKVLLLRGGLNLAVDRLHLRQVGLREVVAAHRAAYPSGSFQVVEVGDGRAATGKATDGPLARHHRDEAFRLQLAERLPDRRPADPETCRPARVPRCGCRGRSWPLTMALRIVSTIRCEASCGRRSGFSAFFNGLPRPQK